MVRCRSTLCQQHLLQRIDDGTDLSEFAAVQERKLVCDDVKKATAYRENKSRRAAKGGLALGVRPGYQTANVVGQGHRQSAEKSNAPCRVTTHNKRQNMAKI